MEFPKIYSRREFIYTCGDVLRYIYINICTEIYVFVVIIMC